MEWAMDILRIPVPTYYASDSEVVGMYILHLLNIESKNQIFNVYYILL